jgi:hypothetical protein
VQWVVALAVLLVVLPLLQVGNGEHEIDDNGGRNERRKRCDVYDGRWVYDDSYPLYNLSHCSFILNQFACQRNGRPDRPYLKYRWQPSACSLPRYHVYMG